MICRQKDPSAFNSSTNSRLYVSGLRLLTYTRTLATSRVNRGAPSEGQSLLSCQVLKYFSVLTGLNIFCALLQRLWFYGARYISLFLYFLRIQFTIVIRLGRPESHKKILWVIEPNVWHVFAVSTPPSPKRNPGCGPDCQQTWWRECKICTQERLYA